MLWESTESSTVRQLLCQQKIPEELLYIYIGADCVIDTVCRDKDPLWCDQSTTTDVQCEMWVCVGDHPMAATLDCWLAIVQRTPTMCCPYKATKHACQVCVLLSAMQDY